MSGSWSEATRWSTNAPPYNNQPPGATYEVIIDAAGAPYSIDAGTGAFVDSILLDSPDATLRLRRISDSFTSTITTGIGGVRAVRGELAIEGEIRLAAGSSLVNDATVRMSDWATVSGGASFVNNGSLLRDCVPFSSVIGVPFVNNGEVRIDAGLLLLTQVSSAGVIRTGPDGVVRFGNTTFAAGSAIENHGAISLGHGVLEGALANDGLIVLEPGTFEFRTAQVIGGVLEIQNGAASSFPTLFQQEVVCTGELLLSDSTASGPGGVRIAPGGRLRKPTWYQARINTPITIEGSGDIRGDFCLGGSSQMRITPGAEVVLNANAALLGPVSAPNPGTYVNEGLVRTQGSGTTFLGGAAPGGPAATFHNRGLVNARASITRMAGVGLHSGEFVIDAGASLETSGQQTFAPESSIRNHGVMKLFAAQFAGTLDNSGDLFIGQSTLFDAPCTVGGAVRCQGLGSGAGALTLTGELLWTTGVIESGGVVTVGPTGSFVIDGAVSSRTLRRELVLQGQGDWPQGTLGINSGLLRIAPAGAFAHRSTGQCSGINAGRILNEGTYIESAASSSFLAVRFDNTGYFATENGDLQFSSGSFSNTGVVTLGPGARLKLFASPFTQGASARIECSLTANPLPPLESNSSVSLAGTLRVHPGAGYVEQWGRTHALVQAASLVGSFAQVDLPTLQDPALRWRRVISPGRLNYLITHIADLNLDSAVDFVDLNVVLNDYGETGPNLAGDANADGVVDFRDLSIVLGYFGAIAPNTAAPLGDVAP